MSKSIVTDVRTDHRLPLARWTSIMRKLQNYLNDEAKEAKTYQQKKVNTKENGQRKETV